MPIDPSALTTNNARIDKALALSEGNAFEVKRVAGKIATALDTIIAFANTRGGTLVLGLEDPAKEKGRGRVYGIQEKPESVAELRRLAATRIVPPLIPAPTFNEIPCSLRDASVGSIVVVSVRPSTRVHSTIEGETFVRVGPSNRRLTAP